MLDEDGDEDEDEEFPVAALCFRPSWHGQMDNQRWCEQTYDRLVDSSGSAAGDGGFDR